MAKKHTRTLEINIWNFIDINDVNGILADTLTEEGRIKVADFPYAEDIAYKFLEVSKNGICKIRAKFNLAT